MVQVSDQFKRELIIIINLMQEIKGKFFLLMYRCTSDKHSFSALNAAANGEFKVTSCGQKWGFLTWLEQCFAICDWGCPGATSWLWSAAKQCIPGRVPTSKRQYMYQHNPAAYNASGVWRFQISYCVWHNKCSRIWQNLIFVLACLVLIICSK